MARTCLVKRSSCPELSFLQGRAEIREHNGIMFDTMMTVDTSTTTAASGDNNDNGDVNGGGGDIMICL